jgi:hypothetical protein
MKQGYNIMNSKGVKVDYVEVQGINKAMICEELGRILNKFYPMSHYAEEVGKVKN